MVYIILVLLFGALVFYLMGDPNSFITFKKNYYGIKKYQARKKAELLEDDFNKQLQNAGFPFDLYRYQLGRYSLSAVFIILSLVKETINYTHLILILLLFILSVPKKSIFRFKSPLKRMIDLTIDRRKKKYNEEIGLFVTVMNNNFNMYKENSPSAYKVVNEAMVGTKTIRPILEQLLRYWQTNKIQEGVSYFVQTIDTDEANKIGQLLGKLNELNPYELKNQLIAQKEIFRKKRKVVKRNKIKNQNYLVYALVAGLLMIILLNITQSVLKLNGGLDLLN